MAGGERHSLSVDRPVVGTGRHDVDGNSQTEARERLRFFAPVSLCSVFSFLNRAEPGKTVIPGPACVSTSCMQYEKKRERRERGISERCQLPPGNIPEGGRTRQPGRRSAAPGSRSPTKRRALQGRNRFALFVWRVPAKLRIAIFRSARGPRRLSQRPQLYRMKVSK